MLTIDLLANSANKQALYDLARQARFRSFCAVDELDAALQLKTIIEENCQDTTQEPVPVFRKYNPNDHQYHKTMTSKQFVDGHMSLSELGFYVQCLNEPHGWEDLRPLAVWGAEVMELGAAHAVPYVLYNFGLDHPQIERIYAGEFDDALYAFDQYPQHYLGMRGYFRWNPLDEKDRVLRYKVIHERCRQLGLKPPKVILTEGGRDFAGGHDDGWQSVFTAEQYAVHLLNLAALLVQDNVDVCLFGYGPGWGWDSFNIEHYHQILNLMIEVNQLEWEQLMARNWTTMIAKKRTPTSGAFVNVRAQPSGTGSLLGEIKEDDIVQIDGNVASNGYVLVKWGNVEAWAYVNGNLKFDVYTPTEPEPVPIPLPDPNTELYKNIITNFKELELAAGNIALFMKELWGV